MKPARADWLFLAGVTALYLVLFWPGITAGKLLAPGDGQDYFLPMFLAPKTLWDPSFQNGYPLGSDPQVMTWYPVARLFGLMGSWNAFIVFCYIGAACGMYAYALSLTGKRAAAAVAGVVYSMSGFMIGQLGHLTFINAGCWIPGVLLGVEQAAQRASWRWAMAAAGCFAMIFLSGNPQLSVYTGLFVAARLAVLATERRVRWRAAIVALAATGAVTAGLGAIQLLPSRELQSLSERATIDYPFFSAYSLNPVELLTGLFPYVLGSRGSPPYPQPYVGWSFVEGSFHVGFIVLFLAMAALWRERQRARFWGWAFVAAVLLASDGWNALGRILFHVPIYQLFRAHGRWMLYADLSAAVLAAHGCAALLEGVSWRDALRLAGSFLAAIAVALYALFTLAPSIQEHAAQLSVPNYPITLGMNAVRIPLALALAGVAALLLWMRYPRSRVAQALVGGALVASLFSQARYDEWRTWPAFTTADLKPPAALDGFAREARARHDSLMALDPGAQPTYEGEPVDYSRLWRWPSASAYHPLYVERFGDILGLNSAGAFHGAPGLFLGPALDVNGVRFVAVISHASPATIAWGNWRLPDERIDFMIGNPIGGQPALRWTEMPIPGDAQKILLVSTLGASAPVRQGETVAEAVLTLASGREAVYPIRAGIDTAEHALECVDVRPIIQHGPAPVFDTHMMPRGGQDCATHNYITTIDLGAHEPILRARFRYVHAQGDLIVSHIWYVRADGSVSAADVASAIRDSPWHWRPRGATAHARVFENLQTMDRAWVTPAVRRMPSVEIELAMHSGAFADGSPFDPRQTALVEAEVAGWTGDSALAGSAHVAVTGADTAVDVEVDTPARGLLVLRDVYYPGWRAYRNGAAAPIYQTDFTGRGVVVEAGHSRVRFEYAPGPFRLGAAMAAAAAAFALASCFYGPLRARLERLFGSGPAS